MALIVCPLCVREDDVVLVRTLPDGRKEARCDDCDFTFTYGSPTPEPKPVTRPRSTTRKAAAAPARPSTLPISVARKQFPTVADADPEARERVAELEQAFLAGPFTPDPVVVAHAKKYAWVFSADGLDRAAVFDLQQFVHDPTGGSPGSTTELDKAWTLMGELEGARRVRAVVQHLLRGPGDLEDRFTELADGTFAMAMPGFGEALLTKTLTIAQPYRFLPVLTHDLKRELADSLFGVELPASGTAAWTTGRLAVWGNDLLLELLGDDFEDLHHAAAFLRSAR